MGNFYESVTLKGPDQGAIAAYLEKDECRAFLTPTVGAVTTVASEQHGEQDTSALGPYAQRLSEHFRCPVLAVMNHDDDILAYALYDNGVRDHAYNSAPWYFDGEQLGGDFDLPEDQIPAEPKDWDTDPEYPAGGNAEALARLIGKDADVAEVERVLHTPESDDSDEFVFAFERHEALLKALGLPTCAVCYGVRYLTGEDAGSVDMTDILKIGSGAN